MFVIGGIGVRGEMEMDRVFTLKLINPSIRKPVIEHMLNDLCQQVRNDNILKQCFLTQITPKSRKKDHKYQKLCNAIKVKKYQDIKKTNYMYNNRPGRCENRLNAFIFWVQLTLFDFRKSNIRKVVGNFTAISFISNGGVRPRCK